MRISTRPKRSSSKRSGCWQNPPNTIVDETQKPTVIESAQSLQIGEKLDNRSDSSDSRVDCKELR
ncbi:hypothetical protein ES707_06771 [subsurface metagenome]